ELDVNTVDQYAEGNVLLENNEIEKIIAKLLDESSYTPETAQTIAIYLQIIEESVATEEILDDNVIIFIVLQADENEESVGQKIKDKNEVSDLSVTAAKVFNAMQTVIQNEEQEISELNLSLEKLGF
ncbi:4246_t:CDS:1, partial [Dentiscutata erythropus]